MKLTEIGYRLLSRGMCADTRVEDTGYGCNSYHKGLW